MQIQHQRQSRLTQPGTYSLLLASGWTLVILISLLISFSAHHQEIVTIAQNVARAYIDKDNLYRNWNALHGGIYVSTGKGLAPNPFYPPSITERDVITPSGRHLTLVNPEYMTRQIYEYAQKEHQISGRITSINPLRPGNKADVWEESALRDFEQGQQEVSSVETENHTRYLRLMRPLVTEESCLPCHAHQGYKQGDIRGGISIKLPMRLFDPASRRQIGLIWVGHTVMWLLGLAGLYAGYTGLKRLNTILENQAATDPLTGLFNRRRFLELLQTNIQEAKRYSIPLVLIFFDVDYFKMINDTYGHETGDSVLQELARIVTGMIRKTDVFARLGGEEFVILVHNNDIKTGSELAEKIRIRAEEHRFQHLDKVTCSFGVVQFYPDDTAETMIRRADEAMYAAKQAGRNRVETRHGDQTEAAPDYPGP